MELEIDFFGVIHHKFDVIRTVLIDRILFFCI